MESNNKFLIDSRKLLSKQKLPIVIKDKVLLASGTWNGNQYTSDEINSAFGNTDWTDKSNRHLYLDHMDTQKQGVGNWAGYVENIRLDEGRLLGDLHIWNDKLGLYVNEAKAKFGISATLRGFEEPGSKVMQDFRFESFSIVTDPACKEAFINLSKKDDLKTDLAEVTDMEATRERMGMSVGQFYAAPRDPPSNSALPIFDKVHAQNAMARFNQTDFKSSEERSKAKGKIISAANKFGIEVSDQFKSLSKDSNKVERRLKVIMSEEVQNKESEQPNEEATESNEKATEAPAEEAKAEEAKTEEKEESNEEAATEESGDSKEESLADKSLASMSKEDLGLFNTFVLSYAKSNPKSSMKDVLLAYEAEKNRTSELNELSDADLLTKISEMNEILRMRSLQANKETSEMKIEKLSSTVKELQDKLREPARKTLNATAPAVKQNKFSDGSEAMADFLLNGGHGSFSLQ